MTHSFINPSSHLPLAAAHIYISWLSFRASSFETLTLLLESYHIMHFVKMSILVWKAIHMHVLFTRYNEMAHALLFKNMCWSHMSTWCNWIYRPILIYPFEWNHDQNIFFRITMGTLYHYLSSFALGSKISLTCHDLKLFFGFIWDLYS